MQKMNYSRSTGKIVAFLRQHANPANVKGMARFGINPDTALGIPMPLLRGLAKDIGRDHALARDLWASGIHEARILAGLIAESEKVDEKMMEAWAGDFDSWDVCDQVCSNLFDKTRFAPGKADEWSRRPETFVKRAGFVLMAALSVHDKEMADSQFIRFLNRVKSEARDDRNFVKKAVNWALRQIGKRNEALNRAAIAAAREIRIKGTKSGRWIAADALRELTSPAVQERLRLRAARK